MPMAIVYDLEAVEIDHDQRTGDAVSPGPSHLRVQVLIEASAVVDFRERVDRRECMELVGERRQLSVALEENVVSSANQPTDECEDRHSSTGERYRKVDGI